MSKILVELRDHMGSDRAIAESAWTSSTEHSDIDLKSDADVERLVKRLARDGHGVPFESAIFRFWIRMPIQTDRQHMTHRIASHSGLSGRYRTMPTDWLDVPSDVLELFPDAASAAAFEDEYHNICENVNDWYANQISRMKKWRDADLITGDGYKRIREFARGVLPLNNMTERVTVINLRSFANYMMLRKKKAAQPEVRQVAQRMYELVRDANICPVAFRELEANNWKLQPPEEE